MPLFQEYRFYPISGKLIVLSNVSLEPAFKVIQFGLFHGNKIYKELDGVDRQNNLMCMVKEARLYLHLQNISIV